MKPILNYLKIIFFIALNFNLQAQELEKKVDSYLAPLVSSGDFYGTVLFAKEGNIELVKGYGFANLEHRVENTSETIFHIASVNKPITAVGVMNLHENGMLNIDDTVAKHLNDYPKGDSITIKQLLSQTSGIPSYNSFPDYGEYSKRENSLKNVVDWFKDEDLLFEPGSKYGYSNSNFVLLAYIIENVSGMTYQNFMENNIFEPLDMNNTKPFSYDEIIENRAEGYDPANTASGLKKTGFYNNSIKIGSGALYSTVGDLLKLDQALYTEDILSEETKKLMFTSIGENEYGLGWGIWKRFDKNKHDHDGASPGSVAYFSRYPDEKVTIIFLGNINTGAFNRMKYNLAAIYFNKEYEIPEPKKYIFLDEDSLKQYEGRFEFENGSFFDLKVKEGALRFLWRGRGELGYLLSPLGDGKFYMRARGDQIEFKPNGSGTDVYYTERSGTSKLKRVQ
ncbi:serine hydrolase [uncultured Eudoraea sp.]|uniref:serine hydrolase domain-containing protein n=1 Tax=uncultured Eudoraea sp. TaxID=1035614 RepID=UPI0026064726|nr:serine hydrolase [uncultured Eudoraea sp.]